MVDPDPLYLTESWNDDCEKTTSMVQVMDEQHSACEKYSTLFGNDDLTSCSYDKGYLSCQGVHICLTCQKEDSDIAGICSACSLACHENHRVISISTRRFFRCDCGNNKFPNNSCQLQPKKDSFNQRNVYTQNFRNRYCVCHSLYDPEDDSRMYGCSICEDWFHEQVILTLPLLTDRSIWFVGIAP